MFLLLSLLSALTALFAAVLEWEQNREQKIKIRILKEFVMPAVALLFVWGANLFSFSAVHIGSGILFIFVGYNLVGVFANVPKNTFILRIPVVVFGLLITVVAIMSGLEQTQIGLLIALYFILYKLLYTLIDKTDIFITTRNKNVNDLLELNRVYSGIFTFIIGLIIAADRIRFLEKIARWLF